MKRLAVLGSNSFAGSQFVNAALDANYQILGINRSAEQHSMFLPYHFHHNKLAYTFRQLDINHDFSELFALLQSWQPEVIVDFAGQGMVAESWQQPQQWYQTNIVAKVRIHQFLADKPWLKRYIRISTPEVYGSCEHLIDETAAFNPSTPYAVSHASIDMSLMAYYRQYDFPVIFTRFSNFYGSGQQLYRIIPRTIIYAKQQKVLDLHGGGKATRAFIHGQDVADAILTCIDKGALGQTYHFSTDDFVTIKELVENIHRQMGVDSSALSRVTQDRPGKDLKYLMSDSKAREELAWKPRVQLDEGIAQCIHWVESHWQALQKQPLDYIHKA